ncbi:MAG TPA: acyl carrier protein [Candidatus Nanoarchaeia archaeon]|nr:acyl carrier protein [Candidatus Nanoarchaeia archaeon]
MTLDEKIKKEIEENVIAMVSEALDVKKENITRSSNFKDDLSADSLDTVELIMEFEKKYEIVIPDEEAQKIYTVGNAIDYITANYKL